MYRWGLCVHVCMFACACACEGLALTLSIFFSFSQCEEGNSHLGPELTIISLTSKFAPGTLSLPSVCGDYSWPQHPPGFYVHPGIRTMVSILEQNMSHLLRPLLIPGLLL